MRLRLVAVGAALLIAGVFASAGSGAGSSAAAAAQRGGKQVERAVHYRCAHRLRCARVRRERRLAAGAPVERLVDLAPGASPPPAPGQPQTPAPGTPALPRFVSVAAREFSLTLSRPLVGTGAVTIELRNSGEDPHNLIVSPEGVHTPLAAFSEIDPGLYERRSVTLAPGRYLLWCSLEFHEGLGMSATLRVQ